MKQPSFNPTKEVSEDVRSRFYINGAWVNSSSRKRTTLTTASTEEFLFDAPLADTADADRAINAARVAFDDGPWPHMSGPERASYIKKLSAAVKQRLPLLTRLWTAQVGAPINFSSMFTPTVPAMLDYYAELVENHVFTETRKTWQGQAHVIGQPVGVAVLIAPWNAPLPILSYKLGAALAAGCTVVVKSCPEAPLDALVLAECAQEAGLPPGVLNVITADRDVSAHLVASHKVDKVSFTGSTGAGKQVAAACLSRMARFTLELGGKSAAIVLDDADLMSTLSALVPYSMPFAGQICFAQTRILLPRSRYDEFLDAYVAGVSGMVLGDPWDDTTHMGPLSSASQVERVLRYIDLGSKEGARLVTGGARSKRFERGYFIEPTVFSDVTSDMTIAREEIFGPVVSIMLYDNIDQAVSIANASDFGLSGTVFTSDAKRGYEIARRMKTGNVSVNGLQMSPNIPFGGFKQSGFGREGGPEGLAAFLENQAIYLPSA
jgi:aldehyde dehydrogenase (NAD+)